MLHPFEVISYATKFIDSLYEAFNIENLDKPMIISTIHSTSYDAMIRFYGFDDEYDSKIVLDINYPNLLEFIKDENIDIYQGIGEFVYHEFIHIIQRMTDKPLDHYNEFWHNMVLVGQDNGFIHREII